MSWNRPPGRVLQSSTPHWSRALATLPMHCESADGAGLAGDRHAKHLHLWANSE